MRSGGLAIGLLTTMGIVSACSQAPLPGPSEGTSSPPAPNASPNGPSTESRSSEPGAVPLSGALLLEQRTTDYGEALRTASLKLVGALPTFAQLKTIMDSSSEGARSAAYETVIDAYIKDPRFTTNQIQWWRNTLRTGTSDAPPKEARNVDFDSAAVFAAQVVVEEKPYTDLFTAKSGNCPKFANGAFRAADCTGTGAQAGLLTNPALLAQFYANMGFRRVRFVQEVFACSKLPVEYASTPVPKGKGFYTSPWPFESITGGKSARIDFHDTSAAICANCHSTMNHIAPLFASYDAAGQYNATAFQVETPVNSTNANERRTVLSDFLPNGEVTSWRHGVPTDSITSLGQTLAADPDVQRCIVRRVWNWAMSRGDIVDEGATVPDAVIDPFMAEFKTSGFNVKKLIRAVFTGPDFTKF